MGLPSAFKTCRKYGLQKVSCGTQRLKGILMHSEEQTWRITQFMSISVFKHAPWQNPHPSPSTFVFI